jgi:putative transposase
MIPGYVWHITHRCHDRRFLLRFDCDRKTWLAWIYRARMKYGLRILNYAVTSNHIHLVVYNDGRHDVIPRAILLAASRTALEYNERKGRSGAFWEGNYHATAVETETHLQKCLVYVDLNMVRAGVVEHPAEWPFCGWQEISGQRGRRCLIDQDLLMTFLGIRDGARLRAVYQSWITEALSRRDLAREPMWTESIAVGGAAFINEIKSELGIRVEHRETTGGGDTYVLREEGADYFAIFHPKKVK